MKKFFFLAMTLLFFSACSSLPKPDKDELQKIPGVIATYQKHLLDGNYDEAAASLDEATEIITSKSKLAGGKGAFFRDEARLLALQAGIEFRRENISLAASKWRDSFEIQYKGLSAQHQVNKNNAIFVDVLATAVSAYAAGKASGGRPYSIPIQSTEIPKPMMIKIGGPESTVFRFPVQVESHPFDAVVKLRRLASQTDGGSCTATMVTPKVGITAAHCMSVNGEAINPKLLSIKKMGIFDTPELQIVKYFTHQGEDKGWDTNRVNDWLIFVTEKSYEKFGVDKFPKVLEKMPDAVATGTQKIMLAGYSSDLKKGFYLTLHHGCHLKPSQKQSAKVIYTDCETETGSSGGPVFLTSYPYNILAIHTARVINSRDEFASIETLGPEFIARLQAVSRDFSGLNDVVVKSDQSENERRP
jgi:hypothetical protein